MDKRLFHREPDSRVREHGQEVDVLLHSRTVPISGKPPVLAAAISRHLQ